MRARIVHELIELVENSHLELSSQSVLDGLDSDVLRRIKENIQSSIDGKNTGIDVTMNEALDAIAQMNDVIIASTNNIPFNTRLGNDYFELSKLLLLAEIMLRLTRHRVALFIAKEVEKKSRTMKFIHLIYKACAIQYRSNFHLGLQSAAKSSKDRFKRFLEYYKVENELEMDSQEIFSHYFKSKINDYSLVYSCEKVEEHYTDYVGIIPSFYFHNNYFFVLHIKYVLRKDYDAIPINAHKALSWHNENAPDYAVGILSFKSILITYYIQKRQYDEAMNHIQSSYPLPQKNSNSWFRLKENEFLLLLHSGSYDEAIELFYEEYSKRSFAKLVSSHKERWRLYEGYVQFIIAVEHGTKHPRYRRYNVSKLINDLPRFSKDKRAMNIPLLIIQLLFFILKKNYNEAQERIEALGKYTTRYLKQSDTFRSSCFIKMLLMIPKFGFNQASVERQALPVYRILTQSDIQLIDQPFEIEIIPYEDLWNIILNNLKPKGQYRSKNLELKS